MAPPITPAAPGTLRFAVLGDFGTGGTHQIEVAQRMCKYRQTHPFGLVLTTGDNIYPDGDPDRFDEAFFQPYKCLFDAGVRFRSTLGNHDVLTNNGRPELQEPAFGFQGRNYVVRRGGVRFVMVDSTNLQRDWLRQATREEQGDRWTVVSFHHPVYSPGPHGSTDGLRPSLPRLFRRRGVDLVLNGHDHLYFASKELRGIRYVVTGGGGRSLYACGGDRWYSARCVERYHFLYVVAGPDELKVKAVPAHGSPFHHFTTRGVTPGN